MQMNAEDIKNFPNFYKYVSCKLPLFRNSDAKMLAIENGASFEKGEIPFDLEKIKDALLWGKGPMIKVTRMFNYGKYVARKNPNLINIRRKWVKDYEQSGKKRLTKWSQQIDLIEAILLHELTHWADYQDGRVSNEIEVGDYFEEAVYGHIITVRSTISA